MGHQILREIPPSLSSPEATSNVYAEESDRTHSGSDIYPSTKPNAFAEELARKANVEKPTTSSNAFAEELARRASSNMTVVSTTSTGVFHEEFDDPSIFPSSEDPVSTKPNAFKDELMARKAAMSTSTETDGPSSITEPAETSYQKKSLPPPTKFDAPRPTLEAKLAARRALIDGSADLSIEEKIAARKAAAAAAAQVHPATGKISTDRKASLDKKPEPSPVISTKKESESSMKSKPPPPPYPKPKPSSEPSSKPVPPPQPSFLLQKSNDSNGVPLPPFVPRPKPVPPKPVLLQSPQNDATNKLSLGGFDLSKREREKPKLTLPPENNSTPSPSIIFTQYCA